MTEIQSITIRSKTRRRSLKFAWAWFRIALFPDKMISIGEVDSSVVIKLETGGADRG